MKQFWTGFGQSSREKQGLGKYLPVYVCIYLIIISLIKYLGTFSKNVGHKVRRYPKYMFMARPNSRVEAYLPPWQKGHPWPFRVSQGWAETFRYL